MLSRRNFIQLILTSGLGFTNAISMFQKKIKGTATNMNCNQFTPSYVDLHETGELKKRGQKLWQMMEQCALCPRKCRARRLEGEKGFCGASSKLFIASYGPHFGEERPLVGDHGSGTIFMTHCNLRCVFCINPDISQEGYGFEKSIKNMAQMMLSLQKRGCHNINIVTPTHYIPHMILALDIACGRGLCIPLVYNTSGYERLKVLKELEGIVDIYLPDFKYAKQDMAARYSSGANNYPEITKKALLEMYRQVGVAESNSKGIMQTGLMIRHLVMPNNVSGTKKVVDWIANNLSQDTYLNLMSQYRPAYKAHKYHKINRRITSKEYEQAIKWAQKAGLTNLNIQ